MVPQAHGGALRVGNPGHRGRPPSWVRERLREGVVKALPSLEKALATGVDPRTGEALAYVDWLRTVDVCAKIGVGIATEHSGPDGAPFVLQLLVGPAQ